jgi:hypothetical protein
MKGSFMKEFKVLSPTAILGYGFPEKSFMAGIAKKPDLIAVDAGSVDPGPYYLGAGKSFTVRSGVKRDLKFMLVEGIKNNIPVVIGSAGGSGAKPHLDWCVDIILEIAKEENLSFKMAQITADIPKEVVKKAIASNQITPLADLPPLTDKDVDDSTYIVAQIGEEPFMEALRDGAQVVVAGRAYDPACFAALPIMKGFDKALAIHMGKILECAAIAAHPGSGADAVLGTLREDCFVLETLSSERKFTPRSTAAHSLYEKSDPYFLPGPGGSLDLTQVQFTELEDGVVQVKGTRFVPTPTYQVKLEASKLVGYRTVSIAGTADPIMIQQMESIIDKVTERVTELTGDADLKKKVHFHLYGLGGVMPAFGEKLENRPRAHELGIVIDAVAETQDKANTLCGLVRSTLLHYGYAGRVSTAGNLAFPFSPSDFTAGAVYVFSMYHLMDIDNQSLFKVSHNMVNKGVLS